MGKQEGEFILQDSKVINKFQRFKTRRFLKQQEKRKQIVCKGINSANLSLEVKCGFFCYLPVVCVWVFFFF